MWVYTNTLDIGSHWVFFKEDPRVFEIRIFDSYGGQWYDIAHPDWGKYVMDSRPVTQMTTLWGGIVAHCPKEGKVAPKTPNISPP